MARHNFDFAVVGSTPMAAMLAGLLKSRHKRNVCLVADEAAPSRLNRSADFSGGLLTRPESWRLLRDTLAESLKLLHQIGGRRAIERTDFHIRARRPETREAIAYMRHVVPAYGYAVERLGGSADGKDWLLRDIARLSRVHFWAGLGKWLDGMDLHRFDVPPETIQRQVDGRGAFSAGLDNVEAGHLILADDAAIIACADKREFGAHFDLTPSTAILTEPAGRLDYALTLDADENLLTRQRRNTSVEIIMPGIPETALAKVSQHWMLEDPVRIAGMTGSTRLVSPDGAMSIGALPRSQTSIIAGAGFSGAFLAPAFARFLAGAASSGETAYFAARAPARSARTEVAEFTVKTVAWAAS
jgi:hypothetical protein